jgi:hypothetical protein
MERWELGGIVRSFCEMSMAIPCRFLQVCGKTKNSRINDSSSCSLMNCA